MKNPRKRTGEEQEAYERSLDEHIRNLRALAEKGQAELEARKKREAQAE